MAPPLAEGERILVVDDEPQIRQLLALRLRADGAEAILAGGGREAIEMLDAGLDVDAVITDHFMPHVDGLALARHIRSDPRLRRTPIILLTGAEHSVQVVERMEGLGGVYYMRKGCDLTRLARTLRMAIAQSRAAAPAPPAQGLTAV